MESTTSEATVQTSAAYRLYVLIALTGFYIVNTMDRYMIGVLVEPIKAEFQLSDGQIGLLGGISFALFYCTLGLAIAKAANKYNRITIISVCVAGWSLATAACGLAQNFIQLMIARIGVAIGEGGGTPPCYSIISDVFPQKMRAFATGVFVTGGSIGAALGIFTAGWINELWGWRAAFLALGLPGLLVALIFKLTLREPPRGLSDGRTAGTGPVTALNVIALLLSRPAFIFMTLGTSLSAFTLYGIGVWLPAFFMRSYDMTSGAAGSLVASMNLFGLVSGSIVGGLIADRMTPRDKRWALWIPCFACLVVSPLLFFAFSVSNQTGAIVCLAFAHFLMGSYYGPVFVTVQALVGLRMRELAVSTFLFVVNIIGLGFGPLVVGIVSDLIGGTPDHALRLALTSVLPPVLLGAATLHYFGSTQLRKDLARAPA